MPLSTRLSAKILERFRRNKEGSVAVEFGILAIPFAMTILAVLESCVSFAAQQVLTNATDDVARMIRTGQPGFRAPMTEDQIKTAICDRLDIIATSNCRTRLIVDLRNFTTFASANTVKIKVVNGQLDTSGFKVDPGGRSTNNMLRVFYKWPVMTDIMRLQMSNLSDNTTLHIATATWRNEPF